MMDSLFGDLIEECIVIIYMDDIFLFAKTQEELEVNTKKVLQRLRENDLYLKPKKCEFSKTKIEWLGMIIEEGKISMDQGKLKGISDWPEPTKVGLMHIPETSRACDIPVTRSSNSNRNS